MDKHKKQLELITTDEALAKYPKIAAFHKWDRRVIGVFCQSGLVTGKYDNTLKVWLMQPDSFDRLVKFVQTKMREAMD
jgi:hypothetical protein